MTSALKILSLLCKIHPEAPTRLSRLLENGAPYKISDLKINGTDLISLGVGGKEIGTVLSSLLFAVMSGDVPNEKNALLEASKLLK